MVGKQSTDGDTGQVGSSLAEILGLAFISNVYQIVSLDNDTITVKKINDIGISTVVTKLPVVISTVKEINIPRIPTICDIVENSNKKPTIWDENDINVEKNRIGLEGSKQKL